jgi:hypothetical protein
LPFQGARLLGRGLGQQTHFFQCPRRGDDKVVRHQVSILKDDLHRLAGSHGNDFLVVGHPLRQGADADHADA